MRVGGVVGCQYFGYASNFCSGFSYSANTCTGNQYMNITTDFRGSSNGVQRGRGQYFVVLLVS
ncbi:hypothetical protein D3C84_1281350 [compost metagenome]